MHCRVCGRKLKTPESIKRGMGPVCAKRSKTESIDDKAVVDRQLRFKFPEEEKIPE